MHADKAATVKHVPATLAFIERQPQQHDHARTQRQGVSDKLLREPVGRIRYDGIDFSRRAKRKVEEILHTVLTATVIDDIVFEDDVSGASQHVANGAGPQAGSKILRESSSTARSVLVASTGVS